MLRCSTIQAGNTSERPWACPFESHSCNSDVLDNAVSKNKTDDEIGPSTVTLSAAKGLSRWAARCFAEFTLSGANVLSMTGLDLSVDEELSSAFESCLS